MSAMLVAFSAVSVAPAEEVFIKQKTTSKRACPTRRGIAAWYHASDQSWVRVISIINAADGRGLWVRHTDYREKVEAAKILQRSLHVSVRERSRNFWNMLHSERRHAIMYIEVDGGPRPGIVYSTKQLLRPAICRCGNTGWQMGPDGPVKMLPSRTHTWLTEQEYLEEKKQRTAEWSDPTKRRRLIRSKQEGLCPFVRPPLRFAV